MDLGVYAAVYGTKPNSRCPKRHGSIPANHELQESRASCSGHRKPATGVPKNGMGRLAVNFRDFFWGICSSKSWSCTHWIDHCCFSPPNPGLFPCFFSHGHHHHEPIHQATLKGTTNKAICEDEPRATPSERSILFFRATSTWAPDHSTIVGIWIRHWGREMDYQLYIRMYIYTQIYVYNI